jgi:hypothetical protein
MKQRIKQIEHYLDIIDLGRILIDHYGKSIRAIEVVSVHPEFIRKRYLRISIYYDDINKRIAEGLG